MTPEDVLYKTVVVYEDGKEHPEHAGDYVSLDQKGGRMVISADNIGSGVDVKFTSQNPFFRIDERTP